jgi:hypothetical protein
MYNPPFLKSWPSRTNLPAKLYACSEHLTECRQTSLEPCVHDEYLCRKVGWQLANQLIENLKASRRSYDETMRRPLFDIRFQSGGS